MRLLWGGKGSACVRARECGMTRAEGVRMSVCVCLARAASHVQCPRRSVPCLPSTSDPASLKVGEAGGIGRKEGEEE